MATPPRSGDPSPKPSDAPRRDETRSQREAGRSAKRPIAIVDFGKAQTRGRIKRLRKGQGKLVSRVENIVDELLESPAMLKTDETPVIVIVVREKAGDTDSGFRGFPFG